MGLTGSQVWWATDVGIAFERVEEGFETALKDYNKKQVVLSLLISLGWCVTTGLFCKKSCDLISGLVDRTVELADPHAARRLDPRRQAKNHDCLHH